MFRPSKPSNQTAPHSESGVLGKALLASTWLLRHKPIHPHDLEAINSSAAAAHQAAQRTNDECAAAIESSNTLLKKLT